LGLDLVRSAASGAYSSIPSGVDTLYDADNDRRNLCRGMYPDNRLNLACHLGLDPSDLTFRANLSDSIADLLGGVGEAIDDALADMQRRLAEGSINLYALDRYYAEMERLLEDTTSISDAPNLALVAGQAVVGMQVAQVAAAGAASVTMSLGSSLGRIPRSATGFVGAEITDRILQEAVAFDKIQFTSTLLLKVSLLSGEIEDACRDRLLAFVRYRRRQTKIAIASTRSGQRAAWLVRRTRDSFNAPIIGRISITPEVALRMVAAAKGTSVPTSFDAVTRKTEIIGGGPFVGSESATSPRTATTAVVPRSSSVAGLPPTMTQTMPSIADPAARKQNAAVLRGLSANSMMNSMMGR
jgi:hypothetical protein